MPNLARQFINHWEAYGFYAPALNDYVAFNLPCRVQTPEGKALLQVIDPYAYRDRYTMPKADSQRQRRPILASDSSRFYYAGLPGPKWLRYTPDIDHFQSTDTIVAALSWIDDILDRKTSPQVTWTREDDGTLRIAATSTPKSKIVASDQSICARFPAGSNCEAWTSQTLKPETDGTYVGTVPQPSSGWTAFLIEATFQQPVCWSRIRSTVLASRLSPISCLMPGPRAAVALGLIWKAPGTGFL